MRRVQASAIAEQTLANRSLRTRSRISSFVFLLPSFVCHLPVRCQGLPQLNTEVASARPPVRRQAERQRGVGAVGPLGRRRVGAAGPRDGAGGAERRVARGRRVRVGHANGDKRVHLGISVGARRGESGGQAGNGDVGRCVARLEDGARDGIRNQGEDGSEDGLAVHFDKEILRIIQLKSYTLIGGGEGRGAWIEDMSRRWELMNRR